MHNTPCPLLNPRCSRRAVLVGTAAAGLIGPAFGQAPSPTARVVASFSILGDMAREVAPADMEITALVGPDADAHVYAPSPADGRRLAQADVVLVNGLGFEGWLLPEALTILSIQPSNPRPLTSTTSACARRLPSAGLGA